MWIYKEIQETLREILGTVNRKITTKTKTIPTTTTSTTIILIGAVGLIEIISDGVIEGSYGILCVSLEILTIFIT